MKFILTNLLGCLLVYLIITCSGCAQAPQVVQLDAPRLAFALMFVGVCAVLCSSIGGFSLVKASQRKEKGK